MEYNAPLDSSVGSQMGVNSEIRNYLKETAKWAKFISIVGLIFTALLIIGFLAGGMMAGDLMSQAFGAPAGMGIYIVFVYVIMFALYIFPLLYLYKFADKTNKALASDNEAVLTEAFKNLKSLYKFMGIFMAIILGLYLLLFIAGGAMSLFI